MSLTVNYDIKQVTNYDTTGKETTDIEIDIPILDGVKKRTVTYVKILKDIEIFKFGYCCETKGLTYPIFLQINHSDKWKKFYAGKESMYEMQPEDWIDLNDEEPEKRETNVLITGVMVPKDIDFTFDYIIEMN